MLERFNYLISFLGTIIALGSILMAIGYNYNHFYEFLLLGLLIFFYPWLRDSISLKKYYQLFILFIPGAIIGDFFIGIYITELWFYTYEAFWEYALLYIWVYPIGGIVMIQSFLFVKNFVSMIITPEREISVSRNFILLGSALPVLIYVSLSLITGTEMAGFFAVLCYLSFLLLNSAYSKVIADKIFNLISIDKSLNDTTLLDDTKNNFLTFSSAIIISSYLQGILHEFPNVYAKQWIYQNHPLNELTFIGIPIHVLFGGWIVLTVLPLSVYYLIRD